MTEAERYHQIKAKKALVAGLDKWRSRLAAAVEVRATDARITSYMDAVLSNPDKHNYYEILGVVRFLTLLDKYAWDAREVKRFFKLYESLRFSGTTGRQRYKLTPVQTFQFASIYGFRRADGRRLCRLVYLFVPRKYSKTTSTAALAVEDMLFGDNNAQAYVGANSYSQAKICFDEIRKIIRDIDPQDKHFQVNREKITFKDRGRESSITCLSGNAKTQDGLNASLVIMDEYSQARDTATRKGADLKNVLTSSMGARSNPLTVVITTASEVVDGPFARELAGAKKVLRGEVENDSMFALVFEPDADDDEGDPATWAKVQPHLGITVQQDYYENAWAEAQLSVDNLLVFRTKLLNMFMVNDVDAWIDHETIENAQQRFELTDLPKRANTFVSVDLSEDNDFTALTFMVHDRPHAYFKTFYFFPEGALAKHPNRKLYEQWAKEGYLILTPGPVVDYMFVRDKIFEYASHLNILRIGYDAWHSVDFINMMNASGAKGYTAPVPQSRGAFTAPVDAFSRGIRTGAFIIDDNPITAYCFANCVLIEDQLGNRKPCKKVQNLKIDGAITSLMCVRQFIDFKF